MTAAALSSTLSNKIPQQIANELSITTQQVSASIALLDEGSTVPFISRYRKEATGGLDDLLLRDLELRLRYLREMAERVEKIIASIAEQEKLTPQLKKQILSAETKTVLEDLYLPFKPKRRTKAMIAIEAGLESLADALFEDPSQNPEALASNYIDTEARSNGVENSKAALEGARYILMDKFSEDAALAGKLRSHLWNQGELRSRVVEDKKSDAAKFSDYFDFSERLNKMPSHRALAVFRGRKEGFLLVEIGSAGVESGATDPCEMMIASHFGIEN
ncbi:MAG TPA: RNA-binding transcriptional accessory protein, partial [Gammaproteobacteria bacterium]|nr:RNA-binding transcriptional accessory protein [Gammaproteobacteria bacterium]